MAIETGSAPTSTFSLSEDQELFRRVEALTA